MPWSSSPTPTPRRDSLQQQLEYPTRQGSGIGTKAGDEVLPEQTCANNGPVPAAPAPPAAEPDVVQPEASDPQDHRRSYTPDMTRAELDGMRFIEAACKAGDYEDDLVCMLCAEPYQSGLPKERCV